MAREEASGAPAAPGAVANVELYLLLYVWFIVPTPLAPTSLLRVRRHFPVRKGVIESIGVDAGWRHFPVRKWIVEPFVAGGVRCPDPARRKGHHLHHQRYHRSDHHDSRDSHQRVKPSAWMYRASSLDCSTYLHLSSSFSETYRSGLSGHGDSTARLKCFDLVMVISFAPKFLYQMHHTLPYEETFPQLQYFFTSSKGLVLWPWFDHERLYRARRSDRRCQPPPSEPLFTQAPRR